MAEDGFTTYTRTRNGKTQTVTRRVYGHGISKTDPLYKVWSGMRYRCNDPKAQNYTWYGAKDIHVCPLWQKDFMAFREWAYSNGYNPGLELDRIYSDKNYEPDNCRWVTKKRNIRNRDRFWSDELDARLVKYAMQSGVNPYQVIQEAVEKYLADHA